MFFMKYLTNMHSLLWTTFFKNVEPLGSEKIDAVRIERANYFLQLKNVYM